MFACESAAHCEETARYEIAVLCLLGDIRVQLHALHRKQARVVEHCTVDAALVGTFHMHIFIASRLEFRLSSKVVKHLGVLHLAHAYYGTSHAGQLVGAKVGKGTRHVVQLVGVFKFVPSVRTCRKKIVVVLSFVVIGVEEVFLIVETHCIHGKLACRSPKCDEKNYRKEHCFSYTLHIFNVLFRLT